MIKIKPGDICQNCKEHPATEIWIGNNGVFLAASREYLQSKWCECCCLKAQIQHAEAVITNLPNLRKELETACL